MKTIIFSLILGLISLTGFSQGGYNVTVNGTVTLEGEGTPVPYYPVMISTDSLSGWNGYYNMVLTDMNGQYSDSFMATQNTGTVYVSIMNCDGTLTQQASFSENNNHLILDFEVCTDSAGGDDQNDSCFAMFAYSTGNNPLEIAFQNVSMGNPTSFAWEFGDGASSTEENPVHFYSAEGEYDVTLTISGEECSSSITLPISVGDNGWGDSTDFGCQAMFIPLPSDANALAIQFMDQSFTLSGTTPDSWSWNFGDGSTSNEQNPVHVYSNEGEYTVCLTITDIESNCESSICLPVYVFDGGDYADSCSAFFYYLPADTSGLDLTHLQFVDMSGGNPNSWNWDFGDGSSSTEQNPVHQYTDEGVYNVCLTIANTNEGCESTICQEVYAFSGDSVGCAGLFSSMLDPNDPYTVLFQAINFSNCEMVYSWDFGDNTTGQGQQVSHTYAQSGIYTVVLTATSEYSDCSWQFVGDVWAGDEMNKIIEGTVYVDSIIPADAGMVYLMGIDTANWGPMIIDTTNIEANGHYQFFINVLDNFILFTQAELTEGSAYYGDYAPTYHFSALNWENAYPIVPFCDQPPYDIFMIPQENAGQGEGEIFGSVTYQDKNPAVEGIEILLMDEQGNVLTYVKTNNEGSFQFPQLSYGNYQLSAEIFGYASNVANVSITQSNPTQEVSVVIKDGSVVLGLNRDTFENSLHISDIYPNPVTDHFYMNISAKKAMKMTLSVVNQMGQTVYSETFKANNGLNRYSADIGNIPQGIYIIQLKAENGRIINTQKLVKLR